MATPVGRLVPARPRALWRAGHGDLYGHGHAHGLAAVLALVVLAATALVASSVAGADTPGSAATQPVRVGDMAAPAVACVAREGADIVIAARNTSRL